jgi:hypothetical protein
MTPQRPPTVSVIEPISPAFEKVKTILFSPFDLRKWFVIGFCAWLAYLGKVRESGLINTYEKLVQAKEYIHENLAWIITVAVAASVLIIVLWLVFIWLSSRGRFIFLHCVAENKAEVTVPWTKFQQHANSLFLFRIVLGLIGFAAIGLPLLLAGGIIAIMIVGNIPDVAGVFGILMIVLVIIAIAIVFTVIGKFTTDFVVPIMFLRTTSCVAGWREFLTLLSVNKARFALYILFQIVIALVIFSIISMGFYIGLCFCCVSFLLFVPYIRTVILLPVLVFKRAYSLLYLGQFGPEFDVFRPETEMALPG